MSNEQAIMDAFTAKSLEVIDLKETNRALLKALKQFDALIKHQYSGSREAMSDLTYAAQAAAAAILKAEGTEALNDI